MGNRLVALGWLGIEEGKDPREGILSLAENAATKFPEIEDAIIEFESQFLKRLTVENQSHLRGLLKKMENEG